MTDLRFENHGPIVLARPLTEAAREWVEASLPDDATWFCGAVVIEPRYVHDIALGADADGLSVTLTY